MVLRFRGLLNGLRCLALKWQVWKGPQNVIVLLNKISMLKIDFIDMWVSTFMRREIIQDVQRMIEGFLTDCQYNPKLLDIPIQVSVFCFLAQYDCLYKRTKCTNLMMNLVGISSRPNVT